MMTPLRRYAKPAAAIAAACVLYGLTRLPRIDATERGELARQFAFTRHLIPELPGAPARRVRPVHPDLRHIEAWISAVGAGVALNDIDGDGLDNDLCYVDTRSDQVVVAGVPGSAARYEAFALDPAPRLYDPHTMAPMGCKPADMDEDGWLDLLVYYWGRPPVAFLRRGGADREALAGSSFIAHDVAAPQQRWFTNAAAFADLDGDTHLELIVGNFFPDGARVLDAHATEPAGMQNSMSRAFNGGTDRVFRCIASPGEEPGVRFEEVPGVLEGELATGWTLGVGAADLDGDLLPELYLAHDFGPDRLLHNRSTPGQPRLARLDGRKTLTTPNSKVLGRDSFKGMGVDFADLNGDGWLDIYVSNIAETFALQESHFAFISTGQVQEMSAGIAPYVDRSEDLGLSRGGWAWDTRLGDFNNDAVLEALQATGFIQGDTNRWPELHELAMGNDWMVHRPGSWGRFEVGADLSGHSHNPFYVRAGDGRFYDLAAEIGVDHVQVSRGIATADTDGDGDLDFAVANQWERSSYYENARPHRGSFLGLHVRWPAGPAGPAAAGVHAGHPAGGEGRAAIGATARVRLADGRCLVAQVDGGNGHSGARSHALHFGLGKVPAEAVLEVELSWRDAGGPRRQVHHLEPGWHTVYLTPQMEMAHDGHDPDAE